METHKIRTFHLIAEEVAAIKHLKYLTLFGLGEGGGLLMPAPTLNSSQFQTIYDNPFIS